MGEHDGVAALKEAMAAALELWAIDDRIRELMANVQTTDKMPVQIRLRPKPVKKGKK